MLSYSASIWVDNDYNSEIGKYWEPLIDQTPYGDFYNTLEIIDSIGLFNENCDVYEYETRIASFGKIMMV